MELCSNCGRIMSPTDRFCGGCGSPRQVNRSLSFAPGLKHQLGSSSVLAFCVILTLQVLICAALSFIYLRRNILYILIPVLIIPILVSFWQIYSDARYEEGPMRLHGLKLLRRIITIVRVLLWIITILLEILWISFLARPGAMSEMFDLFQNSFLKNLYTSLYSMEFFILGILIMLLNIFFFGSVKNSVKSVIDSLTLNENRLECLTSVKVWLIIFSVISGFAVLSTSRLYMESYNDTLSKVTALLYAALVILGFISLIIGAVIANNINRTMPSPVTYTGQQQSG